ncbi:MAG: TIGR02147 family protein [Deltaproteobacteria bacterium]|nr:TIGR02147 family protein [Deltaproteobacteria bacterium]
MSSEDKLASGRPDICRFTDYRLYLRALVPHLKATRPGFSFRAFASRAGFSSPNYLKLVTDGQRNLAAESVDKFARGLGLTRREHDVFRLLVLLANARTDEERNALYAKLRERVVDDEVARLRDDQFAVYDSWWALVVREMCNLPDFQLDARWIARRMRPRIRVAQAQRAIDLLLRTGLVVVDASGRARPAERTITTGPSVPEVQSLAIRNYHRAHLELASRSLDEIPREERNVTSVSVTLSRAAYAEAVEEIARLRRRLLELADSPLQKPEAKGAGSGDEDTARDVHQVVIALYPVTRAITGPGAGGGVGSDAEDGDAEGAPEAASPVGQADERSS